MQPSPSTSTAQPALRELRTTALACLLEPDPATKVAMVAAIPFVLVGHPSLQPRTLKALIEQAKAEPRKLSVAHGGNAGRPRRL